MGGRIEGWKEMKNTIIDEQGMISVENDLGKFYK